MKPILGLLVGCVALAAAGAGRASVVISTDPTQNMSCAEGTCSATAADAVLNVNDLAGMLASGDVMVASGSLAQDIQIEAALSWTSPHRLTLDSYCAIAFDKPVVVAGTGALTITVNDGGTDGDFTFGRKGHVEFWDVKSSLVIGGQAYKLVRQLTRLSHEVHADPAGFYALARNYDATKDGVHRKLVIDRLDGVLEGLGNTISNFSQGLQNHAAALCGENDGTIRDIALVNVTVKGKYGLIAGLVGLNNGIVLNGSVSGQVGADGGSGDMGGLVALNMGTIIDSHSSALVDGRAGYVTGGLVGNNIVLTLITNSYATGSVVGGAQSGGFVGDNSGQISQSYATGSVSASGQQAGGFAGNSSGSVNDVYATGSVMGGIAGGLVGEASGDPVVISHAYSTGDVTGSTWQGGFVGKDPFETMATSYWDLKTSGVSDPADGAGTPKNDPGITGLTNKQLKEGLPSGFDPSIWAQDAHVNNGYPYLRAVPPG